MEIRVYGAGEKICDVSTGALPILRMGILLFTSIKLFLNII